jgi:hypothetical protein
MFFIYPMSTTPTDPAHNSPSRSSSSSRETDEERLARYSAGLKQLAELGRAFGRTLPLEFDELDFEELKAEELDAEELDVEELDVGELDVEH